MQSSKTVGFLLKRVDCNDGVSSHCETIMRGLTASGWKVILITGNVNYDDFSRQRFDALTELAEDWVVLNGMQAIIPNLFNIFKIKAIIKKYQITLFHAHGYSMLGLAYILRLMSGLKCVATFHPSVHGTDPTLLAKSITNSQLLKYQIYLRLFPPSFFIALSTDIEKFLIQDLGFNNNKVCKILAGIDTNYFHVPSSEERQNARKKLGFADEDLVCALVGRLNWNKGHDVMIDAIRKTNQKIPDISLKCLFVGSGNQEAEIKKYAYCDFNDSSLFFFLGYLEDLREVYWASDIFVLPSRSEGFALVVAEALCCGVVAIRTPGGGSVDQIKDGISGFIVPFDDADTLSDRLCDLARDPNLRSQIVANALKLSVHKFTLESMTLGTVATYERAIM